MRFGAFFLIKYHFVPHFSVFIIKGEPECIIFLQKKQIPSFEHIT